eukprot:CAMPEP_0182549720 /NCGR_PEP_ID=MMETSP1323-20130603/40592_1 /TAXON_ID=236787 /ORGANISM="Florenciella parvula, Strain RCC1693" /LENGTH=42 /DNA_ID= /DNA_START= /DNA_END= /DNA_ORIENTATION=
MRPTAGAPEMVQLWATEALFLLFIMKKPTPPSTTTAAATIMT